MLARGTDPPVDRRCPSPDTERARLQRQPDGSYAADAGSSTIAIAFVRDGVKVTGLTLVQGGMSFAGTRLP